MSRLKPRSRWQVSKRQHKNLLEHLCHLRGFEVESLNPDYSLHLHDPNLLPDMDSARKLVVAAAKSSWPVAIFGDYDADGTPAAALLSHAFSHIGLSNTVILPTRQSGYGLRMSQIEEIAKSAKLLVTVDTGISSVEEIALAKKLGLKVIILDHHIPPAILPPADAVVDPHRVDSVYPFKDLCGCALAFKFICALQSDFEELTDGYCKWLLDLVAISTIADMMPLLGENRALVHYGLIVLRQNRRAGLKALFDVAGIDARSINATTVGFSIGPRLNASGRLGDNRPALELLITEDTQEAAEYAAVIEQANRLRQSLVEEVLDEARSLLFQQNAESDPVYVLAKDGWPGGVVGLVAGKLSSEYCRPVIVGAIDNKEIRASARSIEQYPLVDGLTRASKYLTTFGGHTQAAGLSASTDNWKDFVSLLKKDASSILSEEDFVRHYFADAVLDQDDLSLEIADQLEALQPFGLGNRKPLFILDDVEIQQVRFIGSANRHLKLQLRAGSKTIDGIGFNLADRYKSEPLTKCQLLGYLENNQWNGTSRLQMQLVDYCPIGDPRVETTHG